MQKNEILVALKKLVEALEQFKGIYAAFIQEVEDPKTSKDREDTLFFTIRNEYVIGRLPIEVFLMLPQNRRFENIRLTAIGFRKGHLFLGLEVPKFSYVSSIELLKKLQKRLSTARQKKEISLVQQLEEYLKPVERYVETRKKNSHLQKSPIGHQPKQTAPAIPAPSLVTPVMA